MSNSDNNPKDNWEKDWKDGWNPKKDWTPDLPDKEDDGPLPPPRAVRVPSYCSHYRDAYPNSREHRIYHVWNFPLSDRAIKSIQSSPVGKHPAVVKMIDAKTHLGDMADFLITPTYGDLINYAKDSSEHDKDILTQAILYAGQHHYPTIGKVVGYFTDKIGFNRTSQHQASQDLIKDLSNALAKELDYKPERGRG